MIAASKWPARVTLGGFATWRGFKRQNPFVGSLEDVAVVAAALAPGAELEAALASATTGHSTRHVASGSYLSPVYNWGVGARGTELTVAAELNGGSVRATIETFRRRLSNGSDQDHNGS